MPGESVSTRRRGGARYLAKALDQPVSRLDQSAVTLATPSSSVARRTPVRSPSVLVVEDNVLTRDLLRLTLERDGYRVVEASNGRAALAAARFEMPALVLQDLMLPDINGFELAGQLRSLVGTATPILTLSGFLNRVEDVRSAEARFNAVLVKPIEPTRLLEVVRRYLPRSAGRGVVGNGCRVLVVQDDLVQLRLTHLFLTDLGFEVTLAASSAEALRSLQARIPDVVLADVVMPDLDGFQLCFELRKDPRLAAVPVLLALAWHQTASDRALARRVGVTALVHKTTDLHGVPEALLAALTPRRSTRAREPDAAARLAHAQAVIRQLQRQVELGVDLASCGAQQAAQISLVSGVVESLAAGADADRAVRDVLAATLDAAGICKGALFLHTEGGPLRLRDAIGFTASEQVDLAGFFGHSAIFEGVAARQLMLAVPATASSNGCSDVAGQELLSRMGGASAQLVPMCSEGQSLGVLLLCARYTDLSREHSVAFAIAMGNQLARSLELARGHGVVLEGRGTAARLTPTGTAAATPAAHAGQEQPRALLDDALWGAERLRALVSGQQALAHSTDPVPQLVDVVLAFESSLRLAVSQIPHPAVVVREYGHVPRVRVSVSQLGQVFLHLILNAARALPEVPAKGQQIRVRTRSDAAGRVVAEVEVAGPLVAEEISPPASTPSARSIDAALGLATSRQIAADMGGEISVHQMARGGRLFRVALPAAERCPAPEPVISDTTATVRHGRVLVVDDDDMAARAVRRVLSTDHEVSISNGAGDALKRIMRGERFDVIICDLMMPEKSGAAFFDELCDCAPECARRIIFVTGGAFTPEGRKFLERVPNPRLEKPFEVRALRTLVNEQLR